ncbi:hypothetical protein L0244_34870 [bacterium]|nr:hypothetical protein [bacterium]
MDIEVVTAYYEFEHGKKPRGTGQWAFMFNKKTYDDISEVWWSSSNVTFAQAKKEAIAEAKKRGARQVFVQS